MMQIQENDKIPHSGPNSGPLGSNSDRQYVFIKLVVRHCSKLSSYATWIKTSKTKLEKIVENLISGFI